MTLVLTAAPERIDRINFRATDGIAGVYGQAQSLLDRAGYQAGVRYAVMQMEGRRAARDEHGHETWQRIVVALGVLDDARMTADTMMAAGPLPASTGLRSQLAEAEGDAQEIGVRLLVSAELARRRPDGKHAAVPGRATKSAGR